MTIWFAPTKSASYPEQDCYSCLHKCCCDKFSAFNDGGDYPPPCDDYVIPPDCPGCGIRMEQNSIGNYESWWCEHCQREHCIVVM
jgi:hypothetical protein